MDWQLVAAIVCVLAAVAYIGRATWLTLRPKSGACGGGCCNASPKDTGSETFVAADQIQVRRR